MNYWLGVIGTWMMADGFASLWAYSYGERSKNQSWLKDHSLRILRMILGIITIWMGYALSL